MYKVNPDIDDLKEEQINQQLGITSPKRVNAKFILNAEFDQTRSDDAGRPIYTDHVSIIEINEGERDFIARRATDADRAKWPMQWQRFQVALANPTHPVECIPGIKPSEVCMLKDSGIETVQAAAAVERPAPEVADACMKARRWILIASGEKPRMKLEAA